MALSIAANREIYTVYLEGHGLEVGALDSPLPLPAGVKADYADLLSSDALKRKYPSLDPHPVDIVLDGPALGNLPTSRYDFVVANHVLEHVPNVIGYIRDIARILKPNGIAYIAYPVPAACPDRVRPATSMAHFIADDHDQRATISDEHRLSFSWAWHPELFAEPDNIRSVLDLLWSSNSETLTEEGARIISPANRAALEALLAQHDTSNMHHHVFSPETVLACVTAACAGQEFEMRPHDLSFTKGLLSEHIFLFRKILRGGDRGRDTREAHRDATRFAAAWQRELLVEAVVADHVSATQEWRMHADARYELIMQLQSQIASASPSD